MPGNARRRGGDDELPPDPWAGLADPARPRGPARHPSVVPEASEGHRPPPRRTLWHHPAVWVVLLVLAGILLLGALLEPRPPAPREPSPDAVTATALADPAAA